MTRRTTPPAQPPWPEAMQLGLNKFGGQLDSALGDAAAGVTYNPRKRLVMDPKNREAQRDEYYVSTRCE